MSGANGTAVAVATEIPKNPGEEPHPKSPLHLANGQFRKGNPGGPGRPPSALNFLSIVKKRALAQGHDPEAMVYAVARAMARRALQGDTSAGKLVLDRLCGLQERAGDVNVNVAAQNNVSGMPVPETAELGSWFTKLEVIAEELRSVDVEVVDTPSADDELAELMS